LPATEVPRCSVSRRYELAANLTGDDPSWILLTYAFGCTVSAIAEVEIVAELDFEL